MPAQNPGNNRKPAWKQSHKINPTPTQQELKSNEHKQQGQQQKAAKPSPSTIDKATSHNRQPRQTRPSK